MTMNIDDFMKDKNNLYKRITVETKTKDDIVNLLKFCINNRTEDTTNVSKIIKFLDTVYSTSDDIEKIIRTFN